eukprot:6200396-Pleurochrysis_carterae.AAC.1
MLPLKKAALLDKELGTDEALLRARLPPGRRIGFLDTEPCACRAACASVRSCLTAQYGQSQCAVRAFVALSWPRRWARSRRPASNGARSRARVWLSLRAFSASCVTLHAEGRELDLLEGRGDLFQRQEAAVVVALHDLEADKSR